MLFFGKSLWGDIDFNDWNLFVSYFYFLDFLFWDWDWVFGHFGTFQMLIFVMKFLQHILQDGLDLFVFLLEENLFFLHNFKHSLTFLIEIFEFIVLMFLFFQCFSYFGQLNFELLIFPQKVLKVVTTERFGFVVMWDPVGLLSLLVGWWGLELLFEGLKIERKRLKCRGSETGSGKWLGSR